MDTRNSRVQYIQNKKRHFHRDQLLKPNHTQPNDKNQITGQRNNLHIPRSFNFNYNQRKTIGVQRVTVKMKHNPNNDLNRKSNYSKKTQAGTTNNQPPYNSFIPHRNHHQHPPPPAPAPSSTPPGNLPLQQSTLNSQSIISNKRTLLNKLT
ncbi:unnamed protein product [Orchesella dallaii]|uniref:Uncharacterized protein n=1 Tax=Orchesella dallaii TaxID=48710 RepID=A0ABP1QTN5_9HEXA